MIITSVHGSKIRNEPWLSATEVLHQYNHTRLEDGNALCSYQTNAVYLTSVFHVLVVLLLILGHMDDRSKDTPGELYEVSWQRAIH